jgi:hypothetical protein
VAPVVTGSATRIRPLREREASASLGRAPVWAGRTIGGAALATIELERVTTQRVGSFRTTSRSLGLRFEYGGSPLHGGSFAVVETVYSGPESEGAGAARPRSVREREAGRRWRS